MESFYNKLPLTYSVVNWKSLFFFLEKKETQKATRFLAPLFHLPWGRSLLIANGGDAFAYTPHAFLHLPLDILKRKRHKRKIKEISLNSAYLFREPFIMIKIIKIYNIKVYSLKQP